MSCQVSHMCNVIITPLFWCVIAPRIIDEYPDKQASYQIIQHFTSHSLPLIFSTLNYYFTKDLVMIPQDWKTIALVGATFILFNYIDARIIKKGVYPILDWQDKGETLICFICLLISMVIMYITLAKWTCRVRKF